MREEIKINTITWSAPEYVHKERHIDFYWTVGLVTLIAVGLAIWRHNYIFAIFLALAGYMLIVFSYKTPDEVTYEISTSGLSMGKDKYNWKNIKGFDIIKNEQGAKLLFETDKYFLPLHTIPLPEELVQEVDENLLKVIPNVELKESTIMLIMEKIGF